MINRVVNMSFHEENVEEFLSIFNSSKERIRAVEGCLHLELWKDIDNPNKFSTYSKWQNTESLNKYRSSEFFKATWAKTKVLFDAKPIATSFSQQIVI